MTSKKCPICGLWNSQDAIICDCSYNFENINKKYSRRKNRTIDNKISSIISTLIILSITMLIILAIVYIPYIKSKIINY
jgi:uncharacterized membrane protein YvbJ